MALGVASCKKDDDETDVVTIELEDRTLQQDKDMDSLNKYLDTHYYNSEYLTSLGTNVSLSDIIIEKLADGAMVPLGNTLLRTAVGDAKTTTHAETDYEFYVLKINQGGGSESPKLCDRIRVNYEGFTLDDVVFDYLVIPFDGYLVGDGISIGGLITGWNKVLPDFNTAESYIENGDGTINFINKGLGIMFLPSGLAYFNGTGPTGSLDAYAPLIFKFELFQMATSDHDGDGVPSYLEDLNGNGEFDVNYNDLTDISDDDTDGDGYPNYIDTDDDGISTINEDVNKDGDPTNDDSNGNGIPNYLDKTDKINKLTI